MSASVDNQTLRKGPGYKVPRVGLYIGRTIGSRTLEPSVGTPDKI